MEAGAQEEGAQVEGAQEEEASLGEDPQEGPLAQNITQGTMDVVVVLEVLDLG